MRNLIVRGGQMSAAFFMATTLVAVDAMTAPVDAGTSGLRSGPDTVVLADRRRPSAHRRRLRYRTSRWASRTRFRAAAALPPSPDVWARLRQCESGGRYDINTGNGYFGAYQFLRTTWDVTAIHAGRSDLVGVQPNTASEYDQDDLAWALYQWQGNAPWGGRC